MQFGALGMYLSYSVSDVRAAETVKVLPLIDCPELVAFGQV